MQQELPNLEFLERKLFQPKQLAKICRISASLTKKLLNTHRNTFVPVKVHSENGYRYFGIDSIKKLVLFKVLKAAPFRYREHEIVILLENHDADKLYELLSISERKLQEFLFGLDRSI